MPLGTKLRFASPAPLDFDEFESLLYQATNFYLSCKSKVSSPGNIPSEKLYLDLLKKCLTRFIFPETYRPLNRPENVGPLDIRWILYQALKRLLSLAHRDLEVVRRVDFDPLTRLEGRYMGAKPPEAETMIGVKRLDNLEYCIIEAIRRGVPGDLIEAGVWRGGAAILMRGVLKAYRETDRIVWVADSFQGLPSPDIARYPEDKGDDSWVASNDVFSVPLEEVQSNFARYGLLDDQVRFLPGWFKDTLSPAPIERLAVLRLDCDMYSSTTDALTNLYPKLSVGGYVIVDDYKLLRRCRQAVDDFRARYGIVEELQHADWNSMFWMRQQ